MTTSAELALIPPRLIEQGVAITDRDGYRTLGIPDQVRQNYNVIFPTVELSQSNPDFAPMLREIKLNIDTDAYKGASFHKNGECSLGKNGLMKLAEAAKVTIDTFPIPRTHLGPTERCGWKATASQRHSDGTLTQMTSSATFDNEAQEMEIRAYAKDEADFARKWRVKLNKASEITETGAIDRALRAILKLPHKMSQTEFAKPWLVLCYGFVPQTPEARAEAARAMAQLYGGQPSSEPAALPAASRIYEPGTTATAALEEAVEETFDDEPEVLEGEVVEETATENETTASTETTGEAQVEGETQTTIQTGPSVEELAEKASVAKPPTSGMQEYTLAQIAEKDKAEEWFEWALSKDWTKLDPAFNVHVRAFCAVRFPALLEKASA